MTFIGKILSTLGTQISMPLDETTNNKIEISFKMGMGVHTPPCLRFGAEMRNNYIFWDGNEIGVLRPKPNLLPFLDEISRHKRKMFQIL